MIENYDYDVILKDCEFLFNKVDNNKLKNSSILITGANGLIGSFLADYVNFLNNNYSYNIKLYLTSFSEKDNATRIKHLINNKNINYFSWDSSKEIDLINLPEKLDYVFFCSGYGQPAKFTKDIVKTSFINTVGVNSLLQYMTKCKNSNFIFLSSSEIYGEPDENNIPTKEEYNGNYSLSNPRSSYICSKRLGEIICSAYKENIRIKIFRIGLMYGPGTLKNDQRVLQDFIFKANNNKLINLLDSGESIRNYIYLTDGLEIILNIALNSSTNELVYNVGGEFEPISIYQLALKIGNILNCPVLKLDNNSNDMYKNSPKNVCLSMEKYKKEFKNYGDKFINLDKGLLNVIKWYKFIKE